MPDGLLGRVTAAYRLVVLGVVPLGALTGGTLGIRTPFIASAVGLVAAAFLLASRVSTQALRDAESAAVEDDAELVPAGHAF
ncbi:hypothetical protein ABH926_009319 [Catenulispora sp. GP43]|uniref:hypothetical protein n=1 Tax=Catenulispora sp. GP43 TaxID=3156263 RepID=UPI0035120633